MKKTEKVAGNSQVEMDQKNKEKEELKQKKAEEKRKQAEIKKKQAEEKKQKKIEAKQRKAEEKKKKQQERSLEKEQTAGKKAEKPEKEKTKREKMKKDKSRKAKIKTAEQQKKRTGVMRIILMIAILPLLLSSIIITARSLSTLRSTMVSAEKSRLKGICYTVMKAYDEKSIGIYSMEEGMFFKGSLAISNNNQFLDYTKLATETDLAMFFGEECQLTTYLYKNNNKNRAVDIELPEVVKKKVLEEGKDYFAEDVEYCGVHYYGYFAPLINNPDTTEEVVGVFFAGTPREKVDKEISAALRNQVILAVIFIVIAGVAAGIVAMGLARSLKKSIVSLEELSDGNLAFEVDQKVLRRKDEIGQIGVSVGLLRDSLQEIIGNMKEAADKLVTAVETLNETAGQTTDTMDGVARAINDISQGAVSQAEDTQVAFADVTKMGQFVDEMEKEMQVLSASANRMRIAEQEAIDIIAELNRTNDNTVEAVEKIASQTETTNQSVQKIKKAITLISNIAEETNLLSLNASIEAARAGEQGRGFAVVAGEIQKLAEQSNRSAMMIADIINALLEDSRLSMEAMEAVKISVGEQAEKLAMTREKFNEVSEGVTDSMGGIKNIRSVTENIDESKDKLIQIINNLSAVSEENAASAEQTTAATESLNEAVSDLSVAAQALDHTAESLKKSVGVFRF